MVVPSDLPPHLVTEVRLWKEYFAGRGIDPTQVQYPDPERFVMDVLASRSLTVRLSCINAINEWYERHLGQPGPFRQNPWGYPLLTRFLPVTFGEAFEYVRALPNPDRGYAALVLVCRFTAKDLQTWRGIATPNLVQHRGMMVPVTDEVASWVTPYTVPSAKTVRAVLGKLPWSVADLHGALFAELIERGVPETTRASLYGRWSAMRFSPAKHRVGFFRVAL